MMPEQDFSQDLADTAILLLARLILVAMGLIHFDGLPGLIILLFAALSVWPLRFSQTGRT
jgi:hypothetical protein